MNIFIDNGSESEIAIKPTEKVEFIGRDGKDADTVAVSALRQELLSKIIQNQSYINLNAEQITLKVDKSEFNELGQVVEQSKTLITQNAQQISFKASKSSVDALTGRIDIAETNINQTAYEITLKANKTEVNNITNRLTIAESSINQNANEIILKVSQQEFNNLNQIVSNQATTIFQNAEQIQLKANVTDVDVLSNRIYDNESSITQNAQDIILKANQESLNITNDRLTTAEASIIINATEIQSKVSETDFNGNTISSLINQSAGTILIDADKINLVGKVKITDLTSSNTDDTALLTVEGKIKALKIDVENLVAINLAATVGTIGGWTINENSIESYYSGPLLNYKGIVLNSNGTIDLKAYSQGERWDPINNIWVPGIVEPIGSLLTAKYFEMKSDADTVGYFEQMSSNEKYALKALAPPGSIAAELNGEIHLMNITGLSTPGIKKNIKLVYSEITGIPIISFIELI